ncbi:kinase-like protein [Setomelanomma holmii]|uniref:Kinase-like protein n=1 Tax=Setomelanomma holmii TaxID=210430 RepID=A0A9P4HJ43_9PLEO|nr:kinase-like protein [Setomelanomma holmii]
MSEDTLGRGQTGIIDSVRCCRIQLARKKIICNRHLKKEDAVLEVAHLQRLQHSHVVRVVGTYTLRKTLVILLYPVAEWDLEAFMDEYLDLLTEKTWQLSSLTFTDTLITFIGCLSTAICFIHEQNIKHMDIKPKNLLVRRQRGAPSYKIYVADFGIARAYMSAAESETDSPISLTRIYEAPEVALQDKRDFSADIFSLGRVFMEMLATVYSFLVFPNLSGLPDERQRLLELRKASSGNPAFHANIDVVTQWRREIFGAQCPGWLDGSSRMPREVADFFASMIVPEPTSRPSASLLKKLSADIRCSECDSGPDAFEAAE